MKAQYKSECQTLVRTEEDGTMVLKDKRKFDTHDEAVAECKKQNAKPGRIHKVVTYKCKVCHHYHIGRNGKEIKDKYRDKLVKSNFKAKLDSAEFKIVGKIDLSKIPKK
jgi:hypothetical protein